ncbi:hypothetical protein B0T26DRAFT_704958 [Lasiosphaeria miniovina]|uniref:Uncharacterized protein n=1 Tax=Lasiosphaeria miniovina TaxID=1954250 RepID=A0AA40AVW8_9PEZI|nr:uncharacterized protein B0T26DRAFT_704958 [Lasiosphaeria miniovina]KAK0723010.1 hypothetical protein B0T26DRAFT_704958 [Lasiosphaeria miniovina]
MPQIKKEEGTDFIIISMPLFFPIFFLESSPQTQTSFSQAREKQAVDSQSKFQAGEAIYWGPKYVILLEYLGGEAGYLGIWLLFFSFYLHIFIDNKSWDLRDRSEW